MDLSVIVENLSLILLGGLGVFFLLFFIFGLFFRFKKALFVFITWIIFQVLLFVLADTFCSFIYKLPVTIVTENVELPAYISGNTILEIIENIEIHFMGSSDPATTSYLLGVVSVLIKLLYILVLSFIFYFFYSIIMGIIYLIFFRRKKKEKAKKAAGEKIKKHHLLAGLLNGVRGALFYCLSLVVLVTGPLSIVDTSAFAAEEVSSTTVAESTLTDDPTVAQTLEIIDALKDTPFYKFLTNGGEKSISGIINGQIYTFKTEDGTKINVATELNNVFGVIPEVLDLMEGLQGENQEINFNAVSAILDKASESEFINGLLPIAVNVATSLEEVKTVLAQYNITPEQIKGINFQQDFKTLSEMATTIGEIYNSITYVEGKTSGIENIDFSSINQEKITQFFSKFGSLTLVTNVIDSAVSYLLTTEAVSNFIDAAAISVEDIVWQDEFVNVGKIVNCLLNLGFNCVSDITTNLKNALSSLDFGDKNNPLDYGKVGKLIDTIFSSALISKAFPSIMEKAVLPRIPETYRELFDFSDIARTGWNNELNYLVAVFKDITSDPETALFTEEGGININVIKNLSASTLLNSNLVRTALVKGLAGVKNGTGALAQLSSTIKIPDKFTGEVATWCDLDVNYYVAKETFTQGETSYAKFARITVDEYATLDAANQAKCEISYKVTGGELYNVINSLKELMNALDVSALLGGDTGSLLSNQTIEKLVATSTTDSTKSVVGVVCQSEVLATTLSAFLSNINALVVPSSAVNTSVVCTVGESTVKVLKVEEIEHLLVAINKLDLFDDNGNLKELGVGLINELNDVVDTDPVKTKLDYVLESDILHATVSKLIVDNAGSSLTIPETVYETLGDTQVIKTTELKAMVNAIVKLELVDDAGNLAVPGIDLVEKLNQKADAADSKDRLGYCLESDIMHATISKAIVDNAGSVVVIPNNCYTTIGTTQVLTEEELNAIVTGINKLGILDGTNISVDATILTSLNDKADASDTKTKLDYVYDSKILAVTITEKVLENKSVLVIPTTVLEDIGNKQQIIKTELEKTVEAIKGLGIITSSGIGDMESAASNILGTGKATVQAAVAESLIIRATLSEKIDQALFTNNTPVDALDSITLYKNADGDTTNIETTGYSKVNVFSETEVKALLNSLSMMELTSFDSANLDVGKVFSFTSAQIDEFLSSICLWDKFSETIFAVDLFTAVKNETNPSIVKATVASPEGIFPVSYATNKGYTFTNTTSYAFDQTLVSQATPVKRLQKNDIKAVINVVSIINGGSTQSGSSIQIDSSALTEIYKDPVKCASLCQEVAKSVLLVYAIPTMLTNAINDAAGDNAAAINAKIAQLNTIDRALWNDFAVTVDPFTPTGVTGEEQLTDNELFKLLSGLTSLTNILYSDYTKADLVALDNSFVLRGQLDSVPMLNTTYHSTDDVATRAAAIDTFWTNYGSLS